MPGTPPSPGVSLLAIVGLALPLFRHVGLARLAERLRERLNPVVVR
jgi:hypothetical protein